MKALYIILLTLTLTIALNYANGQVNDQAIWNKVLRKAISDSTFIFGKWTEHGGTETQLTYLGQVTTRHGHTFKLLNSIYTWGFSGRATSRILVFNVNNQYVGNYYVKMTTLLPAKMEKGDLIFKNSDEDCNKNFVTIIDLKRGLPKQFFRKCNEKYGDILSFDE